MFFQFVGLQMRMNSPLFWIQSCFFFWLSKASSRSLLIVCQQERLLLDCIYVQAHPSLCWLPMWCTLFSWASSNLKMWFSTEQIVSWKIGFDILFKLSPKDCLLELCQQAWYFFQIVCKGCMYQAKIYIELLICTVWLETLLSSWRSWGSDTIHRVASEGSDHAA